MSNKAESCQIQKKEGNEMKRVLLAGAVVLMAASAAFAVSGAGKGQHTIVNSRHNIPANPNGFTPSVGTVGSGGYQQICIYCHTPHNPRLNVPLWNRNKNATITAFYNSPTLTSVTKSTQSISQDSVSGFCLSCHDGVTSVGSIVNRADTQIIPTGNAISTNSTEIRGNIGTDLSNDHPVGMNYENAYLALDPDQSAGDDPAQQTVKRLWDKDKVKKTLGNFLFNPTGGTGGSDEGTMMECASCHKVHDPFNPPFLRVTNNMSHLCLACHNK
jgi:predicted CXXCH cytochrome family protein